MFMVFYVCVLYPVYSSVLASRAAVVVVVVVATAATGVITNHGEQLVADLGLAVPMKTVF